MKLADLSHAAVGWKQHYEWSCRNTEEFYDQGDEELAMQLPQSPLCDRGKHAEFAKSQIGFLDFVVRPLAVDLVRLDPALEILTTRLTSNVERWNMLAEETTETEKLLQWPPRLQSVIVERDWRRKVLRQQLEAESSLTGVQASGELPVPEGAGAVIPVMTRLSSTQPSFDSRPRAPIRSKSAALAPKSLQRPERRSRSAVDPKPACELNIEDDAPGDDERLDAVPLLPPRDPDQRKKYSMYCTRLSSAQSSSVLADTCMAPPLPADAVLRTQTKEGLATPMIAIRGPAAAEVVTARDTSPQEAVENARADFIAPNATSVITGSPGGRFANKPSPTMRDIVEQVHEGTGVKHLGELQVLGEVRRQPPHGVRPGTGRRWGGRSQSNDVPIQPDCGNHGGPTQTAT